jgi:hypothetical protein
MPYTVRSGGTLSFPLTKNQLLRLYARGEQGLPQRKTPYSIGKELAAWVERLFETSIPAGNP